MHCVFQHLMNMSEDSSWPSHLAWCLLVTDLFHPVCCHVAAELFLNSDRLPYGVTVIWRKPHQWRSGTLHPHGKVSHKPSWPSRSVHLTQPLEQLSRSTVVAVKSKALGKDLRIPYGNFAVRGFAYDDHDRGFANYIFNELCTRYREDRTN